MADDFHPGQRWISESEPELGLGTILKLTPRTVIAEFKASGEQREYALHNTPLRRVRFRIGDTIQNRKGKGLTVQAIEERAAILYYRAGRQEVPETDLSDTISFNKPEERLFSSLFDPPEVFDLRAAALEHQYRRRKSPVRGFLGGRIDLLPHQLYIASEVSSRMAPRVLLADEVGLGKTIEACLILHRLILTGRARRVLILVPESLVHQWFVELLRRFNLWFHIYDEARCATSTGNPFLEGQLILCSLSLFTESAQRLQEALDAGWDMLVVDEAHHLLWSPQAASPEYTVVESLGRKSPGLLLLTATPEQLGMASHFARLRLLDPQRFFSLDAFLKEAEQYHAVARKADKMEEGPELDALLDRHGTGRVRFRNTRATVSGFPKRNVRMYALEPTKSGKDPRIEWLIELLRAAAPSKVLLICRTPDTVTAIEEALRKRVRIELAVFHEKLTLVQRDRNAAWFAEENGARILLCSEIGSEGRNFQFAHHLVLYDLPPDPELLEQRIGRLDRIGQIAEIYVHVPFVRNSFQEILALWYHQGLDSFKTQLQGGRELLERFGPRINALKTREEFYRLIEETRVVRNEVVQRLHEGRDHLLELNSFRPKAAEAIVKEIEREDADSTLEEFMLSVFDFYSVSVEEIAERTYKLGSAGVLADSFPGLPAGGFTVTCDRERALVREDVQFLTWDHPLVTGALDMLLGSEKGNSSLTRDTKSKTGALTLEAIYIVECIAPASLHIDRFLPPTPVRINVEGDEVEAMLEEAHKLADRKVPLIVSGAVQEMTSRLSAEIKRLKDLKKVNASVRAEEIELLSQQRQDMESHLKGARLRLDALRLRMPSF
jgi:ATP-dependent helicase HepA